MTNRPDLIERVAPTVQLLTLAEAKAAARVLHNDEDDYFTMCIAAVSEWMDGPFSVTGQAFRAATWCARWGSAPGGATPIALPFGPVNALVSVKAHDGTSLVTLTLADFELIASRDLATVQPVAGKAWPSVADRRDALQIEFTVGGTVPAELKMVAARQVAKWAETREAMADVTGLSPEIVNMLVNLRRFA